MESKLLTVVVLMAMLMAEGVTSWTGEIHGRVVCDVCADSSIGPEDHVLAGKTHPPLFLITFLGIDFQTKHHCYFLTMLLVPLCHHQSMDQLINRPKLVDSPLSFTPAPSAAPFYPTLLHTIPHLLSKDLNCAEVAVLCITKSGEVLNYQAFTDSNGIYTVAETMPESERWDACLARPISSFHNHCTHLGDGGTGVKFSYEHPSGYYHAVRPFVYRPVKAPVYM
ncbi:hypothetical protein SASPL_152624 [Salvia splendens]|uniref:Pollen Ole e 1 allergen and extensin family protein n=1 Tax=Salvia splendens TaxID=180675 RepID=A0A8X8W492_SALSN|nr:hypothetical protein SASPL_152624 [Salvia splendens]